jgi:hypothetical protein
MENKAFIYVFLGLELNEKTQKTVENNEKLHLRKRCACNG